MRKELLENHLRYYLSRAEWEKQNPHINHIKGVSNKIKKFAEAINKIGKNNLLKKGGKKVKRKPSKKKVRKIHKGPRGGKYYITKGRKVYL